MKIWQYPMRVEPVVTQATPETTSVDKWFQPASEPQRNRTPMEHRSTAFFGLQSEVIKEFSQEPVLIVFSGRIQYRGVAFVPLVSATPELITLDKWISYPPLPIRPRVNTTRFALPMIQPIYPPESTAVRRHLRMLMGLGT